jgi:hypothetical protein
MVQLAAPDQMRGRIMAVYLTMFVGMMPIGNSFLGAVAEKTSKMFSLEVGAVLALIVGLFVYLRKSASWHQ